MLPLGAMEVYVLSLPDTGLTDKDGRRLVRLSAGEPLEESRGRRDRHNSTEPDYDVIHAHDHAATVIMLCIQ